VSAESGEVLGFIVGCFVMPAAVDDADPYVGEGPEDGVMAPAFFLLLLVIGAGPLAFGVKATNRMPVIGGWLEGVQRPSSSTAGTSSPLVRPPLSPLSKSQPDPSLSEITLVI
jgi:hypothetical protein